MLPTNELINEFQVVDSPYSRHDGDGSAKSYGNYPHLPKRIKNLDYETIDRLMAEYNVKYPITIRDYLYHCFDEQDCRNSLEQLARNRSDWFNR
jgi:hypothetical protein